MPAELLSAYNHSAHVCVFDHEEFKYFIPRFLELTIAFNFPSHTTELALKRFNNYTSADWTNEEYSVVSNFSVTFFEHCLQQYPLPNNERIDSILIMLWMGGFSVEPLFNVWSENQSVTHCLHLGDLLYYGLDHTRPFKTKMSSSFGDESLANEIMMWLRLADVKTSFFARN